MRAGIIITLISQLKFFLGIKVPSVQYTYQTLEYLLTYLGRTYVSRWCRDMDE